MTFPGHRRGARGFSLIEMLAVLTIIAILAAALLPMMIKRIDIATRRQEVKNLTTISNALSLYVHRQFALPNPAQWDTLASTMANIPASQVATNTRRYSRAVYTLASASPAHTFVQTRFGSTQPQNLRAIVVSVLGGDVLPTSGTVAEDDFNALWSHRDGERPGGTFTNWNGGGDDFLVQKIDYAPMFHRLMLVNRDNITPFFRINNDVQNITVPNAMPTNNPGYLAYYLHGTVVALGDPAGYVTNRHVLTADISFVFEDGMWRAQIMGANTTSGLADDFARKAAEFLAADWYDKARKGADQQSVLTCMYSYMLTYTFWANQCPHFPTRGISDLVNVPEYELLLNIGGDNGILDTASEDLIVKQGNN